jgi:hypothetical protein
MLEYWSRYEIVAYPNYKLYDIKLVYIIIMVTTLVQAISLPLDRWYVYYLILSEAKNAVAARE